MMMNAPKLEMLTTTNLQGDGWLFIEVTHSTMVQFTGSQRTMSVQIARKPLLHATKQLGINVVQMFQKVIFVFLIL